MPVATIAFVSHPVRAQIAFFEDMRPKPPRLGEAQGSLVNRAGFAVKHDIGDVPGIEPLRQPRLPGLGQPVEGRIGRSIVAKRQIASVESDPFHGAAGLPQKPCKLPKKRPVRTLKHQKPALIGHREPSEFGWQSPNANSLIRHLPLFGVACPRSLRRLGLSGFTGKGRSMFTGIVTDIGEIIEREERGDTRLRIATSYDVDTIDLGASISCSGVCLTVIGTGQMPRAFFDVEFSAETASKATAGDWRVGAKLNLERALRVGDELGGHIVSGHVDGVAEVIATRDEGDSTRFTFRAPAALARFIAPKGSVALDGTSLTVNEVDGDTFGVNIIPHTKAVTTWGDIETGHRVNLEIDTLARYVARLADAAA